jgi:glycosyltransferase involved in cell wall biosynthesis
MMTNDRKISLPPSIEPYVRAGVIRAVVASERIEIAIDDDCGIEQEVRRVPLDQLWDGSVTLDRSLVVLDDVTEVESIRAAQAIGARRIPYVHLEVDRPTIDLVQVVSWLAEISDRYSYYDIASNYRRSSVSHPVDVSIIIPIFDVEKYIERCVRSLLDQDFQGRAELIFVDDGCTDNSTTRVLELIKGQPNAIILHKPNGGAAEARNVGLAASRGEFVVFVDGDDYVATNYLSVLFRTALLNNTDIAQAGFAHVNATSGELTPYVEWFDTTAALGVVADPGFPMMLQTPGIWRRIYSRQFLDRNNITFNATFRRYDDLQFNIQALASVDRIGIARDVIYFYLLGREGQVFGVTDQRLFLHFRVLEYTAKALGPKLENIALCRVFFRTLISHHLWAYDRINGELKHAYLRGLVKQLFLLPGCLSGYRRLKLLRAALRQRPRERWLSLRYLVSMRRFALPSDL